MSVAFGFDFDHTLGVDNGLERTALVEYAAEVGRPLDVRADPQWIARLDALLTEFRNGRIALAEMLARFAAAIGAPPDALDGERWKAICIALVDRLVRPVDGARDLLATLAERGIPVAILTNGWTPLQQRKIARALPGVDGALPILVSDVVGAAKPAAAAFDALVGALGVRRDAVWYVGDNPRTDVAGALGAGLRAVWFDWEGHPYPGDVPAPTLRIAALRELEDAAENTIAP